MSRKVDLNAPRNNSENYKKSRNIHSFSHAINDNHQENNNLNDDSFNDNEVTNDNNVNKSNITSTARSTANNLYSNSILSDVQDKIKVTIKGNIIKKAVIPALFICLPIFIFLMVFVVLFSGESDKNIGLSGYSYYDGACYNVRVEGTLMSIEDYVAGVIAAEVGGFPDETLKAFALAARTYVIQSGKRVGTDPESCYYEIASSEGAQVYTSTTNEKYPKIANETRGLIITVDGTPKTYYDASCIYTPTQAAKEDSSQTFSDDYYYVKYGSHTIGGTNFQAIPKDIALTLGSFRVYISDEKPCVHNHGYGMSQNGAYYLEKYQNYSWKEIIDYYYQSKEEIQSIYKGFGNADYSGEYPIDPNNEMYQNLQFLINKPFNEFLSENGSSVEEFNSAIRSSVEEAGAGTRNGVVTAGINLIGYLANMGVKLNYQWGGKYYQLGTNSNWGTKASMHSLCDNFANRYTNRSYSFQYGKCMNNWSWNSFDCSGFVNWAIRNGTEGKYTQILSIADVRSSGIDLNSSEAVCEPGGVLASSGHIVLVVGTDAEKRQYIVAESTSSNVASGTGGVKLSYYKYNASGYRCNNLNFVYGD